jgi:hypothetical protein
MFCLGGLTGGTSGLMNCDERRVAGRHAAAAVDGLARHRARADIAPIIVLSVVDGEFLGRDDGVMQKLVARSACLLHTNGMMIEGRLAG